MSGRVTLRQAEKEFGVCRHTLRAWLAEAGLGMPSVKRGSKMLILREDVARAIGLHCPRWEGA
jgi:hypothetical protein